MRRPSRLVYLSPVGGLGGAEQSLLDLLAACREVLPSASLHLVCGADGPLVPAAAALAVEVEVIPFDPELVRAGDTRLRTLTAGRRAAAGVEMAARIAPSVLRAGWSWRRHLDRLRPDLIHSNGMKTHLLSALVAPRVPLLWHLRDFLGERPAMSRVLFPLSLRTSLVVANSQAVAADARQVLPRSVRVDVLHNGIDDDRFSPGSASATLGWNPPEGAVRVVLVATYARWKGQDVLLRALGMLQRRRPGLVHAAIVGGPIYDTESSQWSQAELQAIADGEGVGNAVTFLPFLREPREAYRAADVVVHASTRPEPFGRTVVEAMACEKPVIVSRAGGALELYVEGESALGVPPGDPGALAAALERLADSPELRRTLAANARMAAVERFSRAVLAKRLLALYAPMLAMGGS